MSPYTIPQWLLLFYFYCLCGWIWESCYVSARQHRWVNRGFLHGPLLPIYGSGAILILFVTLPVKDSTFLLCLTGTAAATALEYATGAAMEALFRVRYWDYSRQRFQLHGYICLTSSVAWALFSWLLVRVIHPPVDLLLGRLPQTLAVPLAAGLTALFVYDAVISVRAALDLRMILGRLTEENEDLRRFAKRAEVIFAFAEEDLREFREQTELDRVLLRSRLEEDYRHLQETRRLRRVFREQGWEIRLEEAIHVRIEARRKAQQAVINVLERCRSELETGVSPAASGPSAETLRAEIGEAVDALRTLQTRTEERSMLRYRRAVRILRGNPSAAAKRYAEAMENLRSVGGLPLPRKKKK